MNEGSDQKKEDDTSQKKPFKIKKVSSNRTIARPTSPRDTTPLIVNGEEINRDEITPILVSPEIIKAKSPERIKNNLLNSFKSINNDNSTETFEPSPRKIINSSETTEIDSDSNSSTPQKSILSPAAIKPTKIVSPISTLPPLRKSPKITPRKTQEKLSIPKVLNNIRMEDIPVGKKSPSPVIEERKKENPNPKPSKKRKKNKFENLTPQEKERIKTEFRVKFGILRDNYPNMTIPSFNENDTLETIDAKYQEYIKYIHINASGDTYQQYLIIAFLAIEFIGIKVLGLNFSGFTMNQLSYMSKYKKLLIELGEKNYSVSGPAWSTEVKLAMMILFNAVLFVVVKIFENKFGPGISSMIQNILNSTLSGGPSMESEKKQGNVIPEVPIPESGGFDLGSLVGTFGKMFAPQPSKTEKVSRKPLHSD